MKNRSLVSSLSTLGILALVAVLLSYWTVGSSNGGSGVAAKGDGGVTQSENAGSEQVTPAEQAASQSANAQTKGAAASTSKGSTAGPGQAQVDASCAAGKNGGGTDTGVTDKSIKLAATIVTDGPGSSFLGPVRIGMGAVLNKVNRAGGVCGRRLDLSLRNDSWDAQLGKQYIQNFVEADKVFALAVVPSSEGLQAADDYIKQAKVPVIGTDGMLIKQYRNPWIWPVATPTISTMHIMADDAYKRIKACTGCNGGEFGIVFDAHYHFGVEGAFAFDQAVKRLTGHDINGFDPQLKSCNERFCGIQPDQSSYATDVSRFNDACGMGNSTGGKRCDFIAVLLEPDTALTWFSAGRQANPALDLVGGAFGGAQPLFSRDFAQKCGTQCAGMWLWTGYLPPIEQFAAQEKVAQYVHEVQSENPGVDVNNQFVEGGYLGMELVVKALQATGANLTRDRLKATLDSMTFDSGLAAPLSWSSGNHFANTSARAFSVEFQGSGFNGFRQKTDALADRWSGQDESSK
jgi:ABC-type branched-subunit amino acid transport system substrate-binding protein